MTQFLRAFAVALLLVFPSCVFGQGMQVSRADCDDVATDAVLNNECIQLTNANGRIAGKTYQHNGTIWIEKSGVSLVNAQTGTTYTVLNSDSRKLVTFTNAGAIAVTLPQAGASSAFLSGWFAMVQNRGIGTATITPTTSTIDGAASLPLTTNQGVVIFSNGSNYFTMRGVGSAGGAGTDDQTAAEVPFTPGVGANWGVDPNDVAEALDQAAARITVIEASNLFPGTYADDQIAVHNGTVFQAKTLPSCADTGGQHLNYTVATNAWSCGTSSTGGVSGLTVGNLHKAATTSTFTPSQVTEDANSVNIGFPVEIGNVATNSYSHDTSAITGHKTWSVQNATDTYIGRATTDTFTNKTIDVEGTGNVITTVSYASMDAAGCNNVTASPAFNLPTANAPTPTCFGTTTTFGALTFADAATQTASRHFKLPSDWVGAVDSDLVWFANSASANAVRWSIEIGCAGDSDAINTGPSYNTASASNTAYTGTANQRKTTSFTSISATNCAAGESAWLRVSRIGADGGDTLAASAQLVEVGLKIRRAQ